MDTQEAIRRVRLIVPALRKDVKAAVLSHAVMEANNNKIPQEMKGFCCEFVATYEAVQNALVLKLTMDLARIFDLSESGRYPPEGQDKASVQVLAALLERRDVQEALETEAAKSSPGISYIGRAEFAPPEIVMLALESLEEEQRLQARGGCHRAIAAFVDVARRLVTDDSDEKIALARVREFRNRRLAHSLFDKEPDELPRYSDLNLLLEIAKAVTGHFSLAVEGLNIDFDEVVELYRENAAGYANCILDGLIRAAQGNT